MLFIVDESSRTSNPSSEQPSKSKARISNPTTVEMPTKEEILNLNNLDWKIAMQRHKTTQELGNDSRVKISKLLIKSIYEKKFAVDGSYDLK